MVSDVGLVLVAEFARSERSHGDGGDGPGRTDGDSAPSDPGQPLRHVNFPA